MLLERNKTTGSAEPDLSGIKATSAGKLPVLNRVDSTPVTKPDGPALSTIKTRANVNTHIPSPTSNTEGEGMDDNLYSTHDDESSSKEDSSGKG